MIAYYPIAPTDLRDYLKSEGWKMLHAALEDRLFVFTHPSHTRRQLVYPMDNTAPDYSEAAWKTLDKLAEITNSPVQTLLHKARAIHDDVLSFHVHFAGDESSLPLGFAAAMLPQTEVLLKAAACTALRPQAHHPRLTLSQANQLIEKTRFQHTGHGSFVLKTSCPVNSMQPQGELDLSIDTSDTGLQSSTPFVREVNLILNKSLKQLVKAIESDTTTQLVDQLKSEKSPIISSNLCAALMEMQDEKLANDLSIGFGWAASIPKPSQDISATIRFQHDYFPRIEEIQRELRNSQTPREEIFIGTVEKLEGSMNSHGQRAGDVVLSLFLRDESEVVKAKVYLESADYANAVRAHQTDGAYVQVKGQLQGGTRLRQLVHVKGFHVIGLSD